MSELNVDSDHTFVHHGIEAACSCGGWSITADEAVTDGLSEFDAHVQSSETLTDAEVSALPLEERIYIALREVGLDESDAQGAQDALLPLFAADLRELAAHVEWAHRGMTFFRGGGSETRLHSSGETIRAHADRVYPPAQSGDVDA